jgi:hypothetical protein
MWPRGDIPSLGLTNEDVGLLRGGGLRHPGSRLNRIDRILIPPSIPSFLEAHLQTTPGLSVLGLEQF